MGTGLTTGIIRDPAGDDEDKTAVPESLEKANSRRPPLTSQQQRLGTRNTFHSPRPWPSR